MLVRFIAARNRMKTSSAVKALVYGSEWVFNMAQPNEDADWRKINLSLKERFSFVFNNRMYSDVTFIAGKEQDRKIVANKMVLSAGSQVFHSQFADSIGKFNIIQVPEIEAAVFYELIRFLYSDEALVNAETALPLLYAAKTYEVPGLECRCIDFLVESVCANNAFALLYEAAKVNAPKLYSRCLEVIDDKTLEAVAVEDFCNIDVEMLCSILCRDTLRIREVDLFEAVLRWSKAECTRKGLLSTLDNQRLVMQTAIPFIRFPLMTSEEFSLKVACLSLLPERDTIALFIYFNGISDSTLSFNVVPRRGPLNLPAPRSIVSSVNMPTDSDGSIGSAREEFTVKRFSETLNKWVYFDDADIIGFSVDHHVKLRGIGLFAAKTPNTHYRVTVKVMGFKTRKALCDPVKSKITTGDREVYKIMFKQPIELTAFSKYIISVEIQGPPSLYGTGGKKKVSVGLPSARTIVVTFIDVDDKCRVTRTGVESGQIPVLFFAS